MPTGGHQTGGLSRGPRNGPNNGDWGQAEQRLGLRPLGGGGLAEKPGLEAQHQAG